LDLVASLNRPGGNVTGVTSLGLEVTPKRLELLHELVPTASVIALLINRANPALAEPILRASQAAAGGLVIGADPIFTSRQEQLAALALRQAVPTIYQNRGFVAAGGLASYSGSTDADRLAGVTLKMKFVLGIARPRQGGDRKKT
jgi:putative ABC transport system substrate-binding protein